MFSPFTEAICLACRGKARAQAAASTASLFMYSSVGGLGIDCQGMEWMGHQIVDKIIHKAKPGHGPQPLEFGRHHLHAVVTSTVTATSMANVQMGFVNDLQFDWFKRGQSFAQKCYSVSAHGITSVPGASEMPRHHPSCIGPARVTGR